MHSLRLWRVAHPIEAAYARIKAAAKRRLIPFKLTKEQFREFIEPTEYITGRGHKSWNFHLDRKDGELGYVWGNLQILTAEQNIKKMLAHERHLASQRRVFAKLPALPDPQTMETMTHNLGLLVSSAEECHTCDRPEWALVYENHDDGELICEVCVLRKFYDWKDYKK